MSKIEADGLGVSFFGLLFDFDFILEKPATRPRDRCGTEQLVYPFVTGFPGSSRVSALAPYSSGGRVGSTLSTPHAGGDLGLFVGECSSPQTDAPKPTRPRDYWTLRIYIGRNICGLDAIFFVVA